MAARIVSNWLIRHLEQLAPTHWAESWDNVGLLLGDATHEPRRILVALDATQAVVHEAVDGGYDFLLTHHPIIYDPLKKITADTVQGRKLLALLRAGIHVYCAHTNLDVAPGGVNTVLFEKLRPLFGEAAPAPLLGEGDAPGLGLVAHLRAPMSLKELAVCIKNELALDIVRFAGAADAVAHKAGLCGGDASHPRYWQAAQAQGCQVFITGDLRYHTAQDALDAGMTLIDISHYASEVLVVDALVARLRDLAQKEKRDIIIEASRCGGQVFAPV